jgi:hypothetical protein
MALDAGIALKPTHPGEITSGLELGRPRVRANSAPASPAPRNLPLPAASVITIRADIVRSGYPMPQDAR